MPLKRKAEATKASSEEVATPVKRVRGSMSDSASRDTPEVSLQFRRDDDGHDDLQSTV